MEIIYYILLFFIIIVSVLPLSYNKHWIVRTCDFFKVHLFFWFPISIIFGLFFVENHDGYFWLSIFISVLFTIYHGISLLKYTPLFRLFKKDKRKMSGDLTLHKLLSFNVYQHSKKYDNLLNLIDEVKPDLLLTIESNSEWESALTPIESEYCYNVKVPLENTYGMHLYSKLPIIEHSVHFHVSDDLPSIDARIKSKDGKVFTFYGVHPPPPSPTEEETSKERDGELMKIAQDLKNRDQETFLVAGDFNNVAWARSSRLFRKATGLIDPREGIGLIASFHAKYRLIRVPIDLLFHSDTIFIKTLKRLRNIGSDHFPIYCEFYVEATAADNDNHTLTESEEEKMQEDIIEGLKEDGDR